MTQTNDATLNAEHDELTAMMASAGLLADEAPAIAGADEIMVEDEPVEAAPMTAGANIIDELEAALAQLTIEAGPAEPVAVETAVEAQGDEIHDAETDSLNVLRDEVAVNADDILGDDDIEALVNELAVEEAKAEAYAAQGSEVEVTGNEGTAPATPAVAKPPKAPPAPRVSRLAGSTHGAYVATVMSDPALEAAVAGLPKKVKDKATNLVDHIQMGRPLSVYTRVALDMLQKDGSLSNSKLVDALTTHAKRSNPGAGYSIGTARSQAGQMMSLFGKLGICATDGAKGLVPNAESALWQKLTGTAPAST